MFTIFSLLRRLILRLMTSISPSSTNNPPLANFIFTFYLVKHASLGLAPIRVLATVIMDEQISPDLLSDLPLDIIHIILSFVPIRDAIGTSLLSSQWRYVWTSLPYLVFDEEFLDPPMKPWSDEKRLIRFISKVLLLHKGPIHTFEFRFPFLAMYRPAFQCINQWILFLSRNDIRILNFKFFDSFGFEIHSSLYSCQNLTRLKLSLRTIPPPPPSFKGFLLLRSLNIYLDGANSSTIESIVAHCPVLEVLRLDGTQYSEMIIRAPSLKFFRFNGGCTHLSLSTPLLEKLTVRFAHIERFSFLESSVFHHLRIIRLDGVPFNKTEVTMAVDRLITCSVNLQKLKISTWPPELACVSSLDSETARNITYDSLKVIKIEDCGYGTKLIKFLLARSPVLEKMVYRLCWSHSEQEFLNITAELLSYHRASARAEIAIY